MLLVQRIPEWSEPAVLPPALPAAQASSHPAVKRAGAKRKAALAAAGAGATATRGETGDPERQAEPAEPAPKRWRPQGAAVPSGSRGPAGAAGQQRKQGQQQAGATRKQCAQPLQLREGVPGAPPQQLAQPPPAPSGAAGAAAEAADTQPAKRQRVQPPFFAQRAAGSSKGGLAAAAAAAGKQAAAASAQQPVAAPQALPSTASAELPAVPGVTPEVVRRLAAMPAAERPRCGACKPCLNLKLKKACITRRALAEREQDAQLEGAASALQQLASPVQRAPGPGAGGAAEGSAQPGAARGQPAAQQRGTEAAAKRRPGRPRKHPLQPGAAKPPEPAAAAGGLRKAALHKHAAAGKKRSKGKASQPAVPGAASGQQQQQAAAAAEVRCTVAACWQVGRRVWDAQAQAQVLMGPSPSCPRPCLMPAGSAQGAVHRRALAAHPGQRRPPRPGRQPRAAAPQPAAAGWAGGCAGDSLRLRVLDTRQGWLAVIALPRTTPAALCWPLQARAAPLAHYPADDDEEAGDGSPDGSQYCWQSDSE